MNNFKTSKGTELPLLNLRGKDYLEVKFRIVWFREDHPTWSIETDIASRDQNSACFRATIKDESGRVITTSHKCEDKNGFPDFLEKAETGAIGRALALIGYGTQFCADELDEGKRIVDSPVGDKATTQPKTKPQEKKQADKPAAAQAPANSEGLDGGDYIVAVGRKYKGRPLKDIPAHELEGYYFWLKAEVNKKGKSDQYTEDFFKATEFYLKIEPNDTLPQALAD